MENFSLSKRQSQEIAKVLVGDIKGYVLDNFERYFVWFLNDIRKSKDKPPLAPIVVERIPCSYCDRRDLTGA